MSYGAGSKVINAVYGNIADDGAMDDADTELATLLGPRTIPLPLSGVNGESAWVWEGSNDPPRWGESGALNKILTIDMPVHGGMIVDTITLMLGGAADVGDTPDGLIAVYRKEVITGGAKEVVVTLDDTDPWVIGALTPTKTQYTGLAITIADGYVYWIELVSVGGGAGGDECYYYGGQLDSVKLGV